jgi:hypothetical protein
LPEFEIEYHFRVWAYDTWLNYPLIVDNAKRRVKLFYIFY